MGKEITSTEREFIDALLGWQCPSDSNEETGLRLFRFELHCGYDIKVEASKNKETGEWLIVKVINQND